MAEFGADIESDLNLLDVKLKQLKNEYEQHFLGSRPREPQILRAEVQKMAAYYANVPIRNTAHRFRFNNLQARFFALRRHWDITVRKIDAGTYERHVFKARLHERDRPASADRPKPAGAGSPDLFEQYLEARRACGQSLDVDRKQLGQALEKQRQAIRSRYGCEDVRFRVVVEEGRVKLKATPVRSG
jgi:hypothetical protein